MTIDTRLASRLMRCETCSGPFKLWDVCVMLATPISGAEPEISRIDKVRKLLLELHHRSLLSITWQDTGRLRITNPASTIRTAIPGSGQRVETLQETSNRQQQANREARDVLERGGAAAPDAAPDTVKDPYLTSHDLATVREYLIEAGFWPKWADRWCGSQTTSTPLPLPVAAPVQLKPEEASINRATLFRRLGTIKDSEGKTKTPKYVLSRLREKYPDCIAPGRGLYFETPARAAIAHMSYSLHASAPGISEPQQFRGGRRA